MATDLTWLGHSAYGTFPLLTGTPEAVRELAPPGVEALAPEPAETLSF